MTEKNRIYESMTRVRHYDCVVRVWCTETQIKLGPRPEIEAAIKAIEPFRRLDPSHVGSTWPLDIAYALDAFPDVTAYEILDERGNGAIVYPDWK